VLPAVNLDHELTIQTHKIDDEISKNMLPAEFETIDVA